MKRQKVGVQGYGIELVWKGIELVWNKEGQQLPTPVDTTARRFESERQTRPGAYCKGSSAKGSHTGSALM